MWKCEIHNTINILIMKTSPQSGPRFFSVFTCLTGTLRLMKWQLVCFETNRVSVFFYCGHISMGITCILWEVNRRKHLQILKHSHWACMRRKMLTMMGNPGISGQRRLTGLEDVAERNEQFCRHPSKKNVLLQNNQLPHSVALPAVAQQLESQGT